MKITAFILIGILFYSCNNINCEKLAENARDRECKIIVQKMPKFFSPSLDAQGINPETGEQCTCSDGGRWWNQYTQYIEIGDTIIKKKGELIFSIHKKDTILSFKWECEGKVYQ